MKTLLTILFVAWASVTQAASLTLTWQDLSNNEDSFRIERGPCPAGPFIAIGAVGANITAYTDANLPPSTPTTTFQFCYRVRAAAGSVFSGYSNTASGTTGAVAVPVTITASVKALLINVLAGQTFQPQTITVTVSNGGRFTHMDNSPFFNAGPCYGRAVPLVTCASGSQIVLTPSDTVATLAPGTYTENLAVSSPGAPDLAIPVTLIVGQVTITAPGGLVITVGP